ncbi:miraculin-like [Andrographis paniculata]|uniref:miraculin-like n=1 Tax=Andrographis paniculata TaxID=175694 RepID=UPI0021E86EB1|nr:miraculin-like [Andrographis paniculata]
MAMEKTFLSISTFSFSLSLLLLLVGTSFPGRAAEPDRTQDAVKDINGNIVKSGEIYLMYTPDGNFPIIYSTNGESVCPSFVAADLSGRVAYPLRIHLADPGETTVRLNTSVSFQFNDTISCVNSTVWQVAPVSQNGNVQRLVTLNGAQGSPGCNTALTWFKLIKDPRDAYNIVFDSSEVCNIPMQRYLVATGTTIENEAQLLQLVNTAPIRVLFQSAD